MQLELPRFTSALEQRRIRNDYKNLSLRVDRRFYFKKTNLVLFAGALNILGFENELYRYWISELNQYDSVSMWGTVPYIGFEFEF